MKKKTYSIRTGLFRTGCTTLLALALSAGALPAQAQDGKAILDALVRKGVLTTAEAEQITKEAGKTTPPVVVTSAGKSTSKVSLGGRLQIQFDGLSTDVDNAADPASASHFFVRRAYLSLKASVAKNASVDITYDMATNGFDAAFIKLKRSDDLAFDFGLRKPNMAYEEAAISSGALKGIERSGVARYFVEPENGRRMGAGVYRLGIFVEGKDGPFFWGAALTNPERVNTPTSLGSAANNGFAYWANVGVRDKFKNLKDASYVFGAGVGFLPDQGGKVMGVGDDLVVGDIYADLTFGGFNVVTEYFLSSNKNGAGAGRDSNSSGFYVQPAYKFNKNWEGVVRYSYTDTDGRGINLSDAIRSAPSGGTMDKLSDYYVGFTYYISGNDLKFQAGYVYGKSKDTVTGGTASASTSGIRSQLQVQF